MYEETGKEYKSKQGIWKTKRSPKWGAAIKSFLTEISNGGEPRTIGWLSKQTGLNEKNLHNIAAGRVRDPASDKLVAISDALGISFSQLASRAMAEDADNFHVCTYTDRNRVEYPQFGLTIQSFTPASRSKRDFFWGRMTIRPFQDLRKWKFRENSTVGLLLESGTLEFTYGNTKRTIHSNEAVYFDGGVPHKIKNIDSVEAKIFIVTSPALY